VLQRTHLTCHSTYLSTVLRRLSLAILRLVIQCRQYESCFTAACALLALHPKMKASPAVSLLLTNLQLLDYYSSDGVFPISIETFTSLKNKGKAFEHIIHHLFHVYQPTEAAAVRNSPIKLLHRIPLILQYIRRDFKHVGPSTNRYNLRNYEI